MSISFALSSSCSSRTLFLACLTLVCAMQLHGSAGSTVGVAYGRNGNNLPSPSSVVSLLKSKNVGKVRIYDTDAGVLSAFQGSGITLIVGVSNDQLANLASGQAAANTWVQTNIVPYASLINCISVGNEVLIQNSQYTQYLVPAMTNVYNALGSLQGSIHVSTSHALSVLGNSYPPSQGTFQSSILGTMTSILQFLSQTGAPFLANVYPFFTYKNDPSTIPLNYALFQPGTDNVDNGLHYTNLFDAEVDALIAAMEATGHPSIEVVVTESGWASQGDPSATVANAQTYNTNLVAHVGNGTPKRPNRLLQTYIFSLFNENLKSGLIEQNFGLFFPDESPVYAITL